MQSKLSDLRFKEPRAGDVLALLRGRDEGRKVFAKQEAFESQSFSEGAARTLLAADWSSCGALTGVIPYSSHPRMLSCPGIMHLFGRLILSSTFSS